jgi:signal transduction histidine kinase
MGINHPVLLRQLKRLKLSEDATPTLTQWHALLERINQNYQEADQGQYLNELSIRVSSREMLDKNQELQDIIKKLKVAQQQIIHTEKLASMNQLSAGIAHEINNPLSFALSNLTILGKRLAKFIQLVVLCKSLEVNNTENQSAEIINLITKFIQENKIDQVIDDLVPLISETREGLQRIADITTNLSKIAEPNITYAEAVDVNACLKSAIKLIEYKYKKKASIKIHLEALPEFICDNKELKLVFINLLINAAEAIKDKGEIKVSSRVSHSHIEIAIADNGCGIPVENITKLFTPFFTTKGVGSWMGLGLSTAYDIVKSMHGTISVKSQSGVGSTFTVVLPINTPAKEP